MNLTREGTDWLSAYASLDDGELHVLPLSQGLFSWSEAGDGGTLLLLHDGTSGHRLLFSSLARQYRVLAPAPSAVAWPVPKSDAPICIEGLIELVAALRLERPLVCGVGLYASAAFELIGEQPRVFGGLILLDVEFHSRPGVGYRPVPQRTRRANRATIAAPTLVLSTSAQKSRVSERTVASLPDAVHVHLGDAERQPPERLAGEIAEYIYHFGLEKGWLTTARYPPLCYSKLMES